MKKLTIGFAGTPAFGIPSLSAIHQSGHDLKAVYTQPDRPAGRGRKLQASAIKSWAVEHHIPVFQPLNFKDDSTVQTLAALNLDLLVVIAYGLILPTRVLTLPRLGCINVHASLLPRWRGASPIQQAILHGDKETGVTIMQMDKGMDTGDILTMVSMPISAQDTSTSLHDKLAHLSVSPLLETITALASLSAFPVIQNHAEATYAPKITKEEACIHWHENASAIDQKIRAYNPWPIAYTHLHDTTIRIHQAKKIESTHQTSPGTILSMNTEGIRVATGDGIIEIQTLQLPGARALSVADWLHANRDIDVGMILQ